MASRRPARSDADAGCSGPGRSRARQAADHYTPAAELLVAVRGVLRGDVVVAPSVTRRLIDRYVRGAVAPLAGKRLDVLSEREREVLGLVARGLNNAEIAGKLFLGETT
ncbi:LuxR C-terminal-related transcriptional regulator, partial [Streptomyces sp. NPDC002324]